MKFLEICFIKRLEEEDTSFDFLPEKNSKNVYFSLQNRHLKPKIDCKNRRKWKLQKCFSQNYDFAFTNLLKMRQNSFLELSFNFFILTAAVSKFLLNQLKNDLTVNSQDILGLKVTKISRIWLKKFVNFAILLLRYKLGYFAILIYSGSKYYLKAIKAN
jgi:hypothetical protein